MDANDFCLMIMTTWQRQPSTFPSPPWTCPPSKPRERPSIRPWWSPRATTSSRREQQVRSRRRWAHTARPTHPSKTAGPQRIRHRSASSRDTSYDIEELTALLSRRVRVFHVHGVGHPELIPSRHPTLVPPPPLCLTLAAPYSAAPVHRSSPPCVMWSRSLTARRASCVPAQLLASTFCCVAPVV